jgi:hypothetical protein
MKGSVESAFVRLIVDICVLVTAERRVEASVRFSLN